MLSLIAATALSTAQPAGASKPLVVNLCNTTPTRVAYSVIYPSGTRSQRRRGWLTVEAGDCVSGAIGNTTGGTAYVHAMSGEFRWPPEESDLTSCLPATEHSSLVDEPPCCSDEQERGFEAVELSALRGRYALDHTAGCNGVADVFVPFCEQGRQNENGFAQMVRSLEVCNFATNPIEVAVAGDDTDDGGRHVRGWVRIEPGGQCRDVWRGYLSEPDAFLHIRGDVPFRAGRTQRRFCLPVEGQFDFIGKPISEVECEPGFEDTAFRAVRFESTVSRMSFDIGD